MDRLTDFLDYDSEYDYDSEEEEKHPTYNETASPEIQELTPWKI